MFLFFFTGDLYKYVLLYGQQYWKSTYKELNAKRII